jgi:D-alanyl-lipoteichoic acid acyltransferase DltB (MBOAT superfamily)
MQPNIVDTNWINQILAPLKDPKLPEKMFGYSTKEPWFFTEFTFLAVFGIFLLIYAALVQKNTWRKIYIISFSLFFYYKSSGPFLGLFVLMIVSDYLFALAIEKQQGLKKKILLWLSLSYSLSFLLYFKYANFFIHNINSIFHTQFTDHNLFLPIGISFYTFQSISYLMDVYRNEIKATKNVSDYAFYMTFFPHLVAGPIVRAKDFLPQIFTPQIINAALYKESLFRILIGLLKKLFIADYIGKFVDIVHQSPANFSGAENLLAMYGYSFQIYFDFSGYSDIAIGIALMLGYRLKENFDNPYSSSNITVFWRKWHISLSSWLRDYIYIPLGGNRKGVFNTYLFLMITMLVGGFWHGADWRFIFWGFAHGFALAFHKAYSHYFPNNKNSYFSRFWGTIITFHFVAFCWIFFRAASFQSAFTSITQIFSNFNLKDFGGFWISRSETGLMLIFAALVAFFSPKWKDVFYQKIQNLPSFTWIIWVLVTLQIIVQFKDDLVQPFIYFQF